MEDLRNSKEYKKAYQRADRICRYTPHLLHKMTSPKGEPPAHKQAFEDRIAEYRREIQATNKSPQKGLFPGQGTRPARYRVSPSKEPRRDRGRS